MTRWRLVLCLWIGALGSPRASAADTAAVQAATEPVVELPPLIVSETKSTVRWLYVRVGDEEYLSRCSPRATETFIASRERQRHALRALVPDAFLASLPMITLLYDADQKPRAEDQVARDALQTDASSGRGRNPVQFLPNLRIDDRDLSASCVFLEDVDFSQRELRISEDFLRLILERRTPMLPPWLIEGLLQLRAAIVPGQPPLTLRPLTWLSEAESRALVRDPLRPHALLAAGEMFAPDALRGPENQHPLRVRTLQAQVGLFVRWGLDPRNGMRDAFWRFASRAAEERTTEALFVACFGFGFSDLRDRLSDYLPLAVKEALLLEAGELQSRGVDVRNATPQEIARLQGEWERLEAAYVRRSHPDFAKRYMDQALRTLRRSDLGDEPDPRLPAALGLCLIEAGDRNGVAQLERAVDAGCPRPRPGHELARFRFAELVRSQPDRLFSADELAPVLQPLRLALQRKPPLPEAFALLADTWMRCRTAPPAGDLDVLAQGAKLFALNSAVSYRIALALARYGRSSEAAELLTSAADYTSDEALRARCTQLLETLKRGRGTG